MCDKKCRFRAFAENNLDFDYSSLIALINPDSKKMSEMVTSNIRSLARQTRGCFAPDRTRQLD